MTLPMEPPQPLPPGCRWHEVETPLQRIGFLLRRSRRKTIGLSIHDDGLVVAAPTWVGIGQIKDIVAGKAPWILRKLEARHAYRQQRIQNDETTWCQGGTFLFLGQTVSIALNPALTLVRYSGDPSCPQAGDTLSLPLGPDTPPEAVRLHVEAWLKKQARPYFSRRLAHYCRMGNLSLNDWRLASPRARWGSCSSDRRIMLNWRLIHFPPDLADYVVAHEVAHLRHMNHGQDFWREVQALFPDFARARQALKPHHPGSMPCF